MKSLVLRVSHILFGPALYTIQIAATNLGTGFPANLNFVFGSRKCWDSRVQD